MTPESRLALLNRLLLRARSAPFYRSRLPRKPLADLEEFRNLPLTTKDDLRAHSPYGLVAAPRETWYEYYESFGTTGKPVSIWMTREDCEENARQIATCGVRLGPGDMVLIRYPYAISQVAHVFHRAAHLRGACVIPASSRSLVSPFSRVITMLAALQVTVLAALPLQVLLLAETARMMGLNPTCDFPHLRAVCTAGEPVTPPRRRLLEATWGVPVFDIYGMTEIGTAAVDGPCRRLHPLTDDFLFEILADDLKSPAEPGEVGHLVVTALRRRATPMIRYLTGDLARWVPERCTCGSSLGLEMRGRGQDALHVGGRRVDLWELEHLVEELPYHRFWAAGPAPSGLHLVVELEDPVNAPGSDAFRTLDPEKLAVLEEKHGLKLQVELVPPGTLVDRPALLDVGEVGKPRYVFSAEEMEARAYVGSHRL